MKFLSVFAFSIILSSQAFASCYETYSTKLSETNEILERANYKQDEKNASLLSLASLGGGFLLISSTSPGSLLMTTSMGAVTYASSKVADFYIDFKVNDDTKKAVQLKRTLEDSLSLLKEAHLGNGPMLQKAMVLVNNEISTDISLKDLADTITAQDSMSLFCQTEDSILSADGILKVAMDELSLK